MVHSNHTLFARQSSWTFKTLFRLWSICFQVEEQMTIQAFYKWSDDSSSTKPVGALGLKFKK